MNNQIIGKVEYNNAEIIFKGNNNIFYCKDTAKLENCKIRFTGSNSLIYIDEENYPMSLNMRVGNDSVIYIGKRNYINKTSDLYATERKNIIIGNELLLSYETCMRTADPHIIYDTKTKKRINYSKSILIGDKVWIGQQSLILKNTIIGSGAIVGGHSVIANKTLQSNISYAGNPIKKIREGVFYASPKSTHDYTSNQELESEDFISDDINQYVYEIDDKTISLKAIDDDLMNIENAQEKIKYLTNNLSNNNNKNRFSIK